jgi:hypothetical protein
MLVNQRTQYGRGTNVQLDTEYVSLVMFKQRQLELIKEAEQQRLINESIKAAKQKNQPKEDKNGQTR